MKKRKRYWVNRLNNQFLIRDNFVYSRYSIITNKRFKLRDEDTLIHKLRLIEFTKYFHPSMKVWKEILIDR